MRTRPYRATRRNLMLRVLKREWMGIEPGRYPRKPRNAPKPGKVEAPPTLPPLLCVLMKRAGMQLPAYAT